MVAGCAGGHRAAPLAAGLSFSWLACGDGSPVAIDGLAPHDLYLLRLDHIVFRIICIIILLVGCCVFVLRGSTNDPTTIGQSSEMPAHIWGQFYLQNSNLKFGEFRVVVENSKLKFGGAV